MLGVPMSWNTRFHMKWEMTSFCNENHMRHVMQSNTHQAEKQEKICYFWTSPFCGQQQNLVGETNVTVVIGDIVIVIRVVAY